MSLITKQDLIEAQADAHTLEQVVNGADTANVTSRLGRTYPTLSKAMRQIVENGLLGATPFTTKALMQASSLANDSYAIVTNDTTAENNGFYQKQSGAWVYLKWNPLQNDITSLTANKNKDYPFVYAARAPESDLETGSFQRNHVLNIEVIGAEKGKVYALRGYRNQTVTGSFKAHGWAFYDLDENNITAEPRTVVNYNSAIHPIYPNTGIQTLFIQSDVVMGLSFKITIDTTNMTTVHVNYSAATLAGWNYIISPDNYYRLPNLSGGEVVSGGSINDLKQSVSNPYKSLTVVLIGDSNCWASSATGRAPTEPRSNRLTDVRNNYTCGAFANLLRKWLGWSAGATGEPTELNQAWIDSATLNPNGSLYSGFAGYRVRTDLPLQDFADAVNSTLVADSASSSKYSFNFADEQVIEFDIVGDNITVKYATQSANASGLVTLKLGTQTITQNSYAASRETRTITASLSSVQTAKVTLTTTNAVKIEVVQHNRRIGLYNQGISGSGIGIWAPSTSRSLITSALPLETTHILSWFGSNEAEDRSITESVKLYKDMLNWIELNRPNAKVITLKLSRTDEIGLVDGDYVRALRANEYVRESQKRGIDVIDVWGSTSVPIVYDENIWTDGTHLTDQGHEYVFESIVSRLIGGSVSSSKNNSKSFVPFNTKALMQASPLKDGEYAVVVADTEANNGFYQKQSGAWVYLAWNSDVSNLALKSSPSFSGTPTTVTANLSYDNANQIANNQQVLLLSRSHRSVNVSDHVEGVKTLTVEQSRMPVITFTGTLTQDITVEIPTSTGYTYTFRNGTAKTITVRHVGYTTGIVLEAGGRATAFSNGTSLFVSGKDYTTALSSVDARITAIENKPKPSAGVFTNFIPTTTAKSGQNIVSAMTKDRTIGFNVGSSSLNMTYDDGETWTLLRDFAGSQTDAVIELANGELLVSASNSTSATLWLSSGFRKGEVTWAQVHEAHSPHVKYVQAWSIFEDGNMVLAIDYGAKAGMSYGSVELVPNGMNARYAYMSLDYGKTWEIIFDLNAWVVDEGYGTLDNGNLEAHGVHCHGIAYDKWWDRIWITFGDNAYGIGGTVYSDDLGKTWQWANKGKDSQANSPANSRHQNVGIKPMPDCILFGTDGQPNGVHRIERSQGKNITGEYTINVGYAYSSEDKLTHLCQAIWQAEHLPNQPVFFAFGAEGESRKTFIVATYDGFDFELIWESDVAMARGYGLRSVVCPTRSGNLIAKYNNSEGGSAVFREIKGKAPIY